MNLTVQVIPATVTVITPEEAVVLKQHEMLGKIYPDGLLGFIGGKRRTKDNKVIDQK